MALLHVSHPPVQTCRGEDILYFHISWTPLVLDPITNPFWGALAAPHYNLVIRNKNEKALGNKVVLYLKFGLEK